MDKRERAKSLLVHYMREASKGPLDFDYEIRAEIEAIVDIIVDAAVSEAVAKIKAELEQV